MLQATRRLPDAAREAEILAEIGRRPVVMRLVEIVADWDDRSDRALQRGDWATAAICQESAAISAHRLGLLEDALFDILRGHSAGALGDEVDVTT